MRRIYTAETYLVGINTRVSIIIATAPWKKEIRGKYSLLLY